MITAVRTRRFWFMLLAVVGAGAVLAISQCSRWDRTASITITVPNGCARPEAIRTHGRLWLASESAPAAWGASELGTLTLRGRAKGEFASRADGRTVLFRDAGDDDTFVEVGCVLDPRP